MMNIRSRLKNACKWAALGGFGGAVIGGSIATTIYYFKNNPSEIFNAAIKKYSEVAFCTVKEGGMWHYAQPICYQDVTPNADEACLVSGRNTCTENFIKDQARRHFEPYAVAHEKNTIHFLYTFAVPIGFAAGAVAGLAFGLCKKTDSRPSKAGIFQVSHPAQEVIIPKDPDPNNDDYWQPRTWQV